MTQITDPFMRDVYCIAGLPIHAITMAQTVAAVRHAGLTGDRLFLSTPNLNFLATSLRDTEFRETVLASDLCIPDGAPIIWLARLLRLPIRQRVAGSDLLDELSAAAFADTRPLKLTFFGGADGVGEAAAKRINARSGGLVCVGAINPGFGSVEELSCGEIITAINDTKADIVVAALGAAKGQAWLYRNTDRLTASVTTHLGAAINFMAGRVKRAPGWVQRAQLEWLWRIKEEPSLWKRYTLDGFVFLKLVFTRLIPLALWLRTRRTAVKPQIGLDHSGLDHGVVVKLTGCFLERNITLIRRAFADAATARCDVTLDFRGLTGLDPAVMGQMQTLKRVLLSKGHQLFIINCPPVARRLLRLNYCDDI